MTHLDEGLLRGLIDGEPVEGDMEAARGHLAECESCQALSVQLRAASSLVGAALGHLDSAVVPVGAKAAVFARVDADARDASTMGTTGTVADISPAEPARPSPVAPSVAERFAFARAAIFVLFFGAVVATALPASPVRGWITGGWDRAVALFAGPAQTETDVTAETDAPAPQVPQSRGVRLEVE